MACHLPERPSLEQLRKQARERQRADGGTLAAAQLAVARHYRFPSWPRLVAHLAVVAEYQRVHAEIAAGADPADRFLALACLTYTDDDGPHRWAAARRVLAEHPHIADDPYVAAARADADRVGRSATVLGGPQHWVPLMHLAYARHDAGVPRDAVLTTARMLLDRGADPNAGYLFQGLPTPFTVLTGVFGGGERDQSPHPHALALAALLLEAGAEPNDGQALYNRMFTQDDAHLRLLLAHGLGRGDGGPWHARMPEATDSPAAMLHGQLGWAVAHGYLDRIRLLAEHGVDLDAPVWGRIPVELATVAGRPAVVELLVGLGAAAPDLPPVDVLVGAALAGDADAVTGVRAAHPDALDAARTAHPGLVVRAVAAGSAEAVRLLVALGFDVSALARADGPVDHPWESGLHHAAGQGDVAMVTLLLELGADPDLRDARFGGTPLDWASHFDQDATAALLE